MGRNNMCVPRYTTYDPKIVPLNILKAGNPSSGETILILGSCRAMPYLNYISECNNERYKAVYIDPFNYHFDEKNEKIDFQQALLNLESNQELRSLFGSVKIFIHEHYANFGMFNTSSSSEKNIYQFGLSPETTIHIPSFHDIFILTNDFVLISSFLDQFKLDLESHKELQPSTIETMKALSNSSISKFLKNCQSTSFPEMASFFSENWMSTRLFCSFNHISFSYSMKVWEWLNPRFLRLPCDNEKLSQLSSQRLYENTLTPLCKYDLLMHDYKWDEEIRELVVPL